ncbi:hypothetical protein ABGB18_26885 [Nonomuraea sp. B12E4]|uniref:hypothetical protein n=1 Tax=Nonomuraea sp. B12E4 TaxID=3153564 RepID=UPI00325D9EBC
MTTPPGLHQALTDPPPPPLPRRAEELLRELDAPPRLAAHLRAVHDAALDLLSWLADHHPEVAVDREAVLFGAATHDIGKCRQVFMDLDDLLTKIAATADARLAFQNTYPVTGFVA